MCGGPRHRIKPHETVSRHTELVHGIYETIAVRMVDVVDGAVPGYVEAPHFVPQCRTCEGKGNPAACHLCPYQ